MSAITPQQQLFELPFDLISLRRHRLVVCSRDDLWRRRQRNRSAA